MATALVVVGIALTVGSSIGGAIILAKTWTHFAHLPYPKSYDRLATLFFLLGISGMFLLVGGLGPTAV